MAKKKPEKKLTMKTKVLPTEWKAKQQVDKAVEKIDNSSSIAKESGSEKQEFTRIKEIIHMDGFGFQLILNPTPRHPEIQKMLTYTEAFRHILAMERTMGVIPYADRRAAMEQLVELKARLYEAMEDIPELAKDLGVGL